MATTEARPCPGCGSVDSHTRGEVNGFRVQSCGSCATVFTAYLPGPEESKDYLHYYHDGNLRVPSVVRRQLELAVSRFEADRRLNRWLDVGCGAGTLMEAARGQRWEVIGTEVAERAAETDASEGVAMSEVASWGSSIYPRRGST